MKVLSIKQPWAELILMGAKEIEYRSWNTKFRGKFLIHSSKAIDKNCDAKPAGEMVFGAIIGEAELWMTSVTKDGTYAWHLRNIKRVEPIFINGSLSFWNYDGEIVHVKALQKAIG